MGSKFSRTTRISTVIFVLMAALFSTGTQPVFAAITVTLTVDTNIDSPINTGCLETDDDDDCSLRGAISLANADLSSAVYHIDIPSGVYLLDYNSGNATEDGNASGDLDILNPAVTIEGAGKLLTFIDGNLTDRVIDYLDDGGQLNLATLTIRNGNLAAGEGGGAGIRLAANSSLRMDYVNIKNNVVNGSDIDYDAGGGLYGSDLNTILINHSTIGDNTACSSAGIKTNENNLTMLNSTVENNSALCDGSMGGGVGIGNAGTTLINNTTFTGNQAFRGAAFFNSGDLTILNSTFSFNTASNDGGAMVLFGTSLLVNVTFQSNSADSWGGALDINDATTLKNVTIAGNDASIGGGLSISGETYVSLVMDHVSFAANNASSLGPVVYIGSGPTVTVTNSILVSPLEKSNCYIETPTSWSSNGYNLSNDESCNLTGTGDLITATPYLGTLSDNGGPTWTLPLLAGSPAIDHANPSGCSAKDQRGYYRPVDGDAVPGAICDIGSFEYNSFPLNNLSWLPLIKKVITDPLPAAR